MVFISIEDFYEKVSALSRISREEEVECAKRMKAGDESARERIIEGYLPMVAGYIRHTYPQYQTLGLVMYCVNALEKSADSFNFLQDSETFTHRLSWALRQAFTAYLVRR